ncbi:conserved exported hypothetical protein [Nitrosopumilaceae archaeon]|nr:conserved exported hypothetical protein [Nitrosopumilaceae archaeon]
MRGLYIVIMALIPGIALAAPLTGSTNDNAGGIHVVPGGDDLFIANTGAEYKFDPGFHAKVLDLMREPPSDGDPGVFDGSRYYNVVIVVARDNGDGWDHDKTAAENKVAVVEKLKSLGARDIASARSLSFVTASIPVAEIPGFTLHDEVYKMGDGERRIVHAGGDFKATINAKSDDIRGAIGMDLDGSGVTVAVIDEGINHTTAFKNDQIVRKFCYRDGCNDIGSVYDYNLGAYAHGLGSAQIIAASGLTSNNGIAPGVKLFDLVFDDPVRPENIDNPETVTDEMASFAHALDWAFDNGADIANLSLNGEGHCTDHDNTFNLIANEAVDKGMILVGAVSNHGLVDDGGVDTPEYRSVRDPACAHNVIGVGGIDDSKTDFKMYKKSSRGPVTDDNILKPDLVAPGFGLDLLRYTTGETFDSFEGTSFSTPFVTATAALMLDARPDLTPVMAKAALLLGADWTGPAACTSGMYEKGRTSDGCSYRNQPDDVETANNADSLKILNNVGLGILDTAATLGYVAPGTTHVISDHISVSEPSKKFTFTVDDPTQTKIVLSWLAPPPGAAWPGAGNGSAQEAPPIGVAMPDPAAPDTAPDTTPPSIRVGPASEHPYGVPYEDPGATCTDDRDPERTVYSDGAIDARSPGPQALRYTCADAAGNEAQPKTRIVVVLDPWEEPKAPAEAPADEPAAAAGEPEAGSEQEAGHAGGSVPDAGTAPAGDLGDDPADVPADDPADEPAIEPVLNATFVAPPDITTEATGPLTAVELGQPAFPANHTVSNDAPGAFPPGPTTVTWTATGPSNHTSYQVVTITDATPPMISGVPEVPPVEAGDGGSAAVEFSLPTALDLVDGDVPVSSSHAPGALFQLGNTTVSFTASDSSGNESSREITISVYVEPLAATGDAPSDETAEGS